MNLATLIGSVVLMVILGCAIRYITKEKKKGTKCIGCPYECECSRQCKM